MSNENELVKIESYQNIKNTLAPYVIRIGRDSITLRLSAEKAEQLDFKHPTFKQFFDGWTWEMDEGLSPAPAEIISQRVIVTLNFNSRMKNSLKFIYPSIFQ